MAYDPISGEIPIAELPKYGGAGGSPEAQRYYAGQEFFKLFGRNPTQSELEMLAGAYAGDPNIANVSQGNQAVAEYYQNFANNPEEINKANQEKYLKEAPQHFDSVNQQFQSLLGRTASQDELNHFGALMAAGSLDPYSLQQFLSQQPEAQTAANQKFQKGLSDQLSDYDKQYFSEKVLPSIQQAYAKQGRSFDSSAFQAAATNAAQAQNTTRQDFLANLSAQQYGGVQDRAYRDYAERLANQAALTNSGIQARYAGNNALMNRLNDITDFNTQRDLYNQYLARYGRRNHGLGTLLGTAAGMGIGALLAAPTGGLSMAGGAQIGGLLGGAGGRAYDMSGGSY